MPTKSKHTVNIYPDYEISDDIYDKLISINDQNQKMSNSINPFAHGSTQTLQNLLVGLMPNMGMKTMYYQNTKNNKVNTREVELIEFSNYDKNKCSPEYKGTLNLEKFEDLILKNSSFSFDIQEKDIIQQYFDQMNLKNDMVFDVEFITSKGLMSLVKKTIQRKIDDRLVPYYDEKTASVFEISEYDVISGHQHFVFEEKEGTYLKIHHYIQLGIQIYTTMNPDENKIIPAVIVEDMKGNTLEVFCYYKNRLINKDVLFELKPNILQDNFRDSEYFTSRDLEFLDMLNI